jgi:hypothetical protein
MNILEALTLKKDLKDRIEDLGSRFTNSITVTKGGKPIEDPNELMTQLEDSSRQLNDICSRIKKANAKAKNYKGVTLVELVEKRAIEENLLEILRRVFREAIYGDGTVYYYDRKPNFEYEVTMDVNLLKKQIDEKETILRELTSEIQKLDLSTEI